MNSLAVPRRYFGKFEMLGMKRVDVADETVHRPQCWDPEPLIGNNAKMGKITKYSVVVFRKL